MSKFMAEGSLYERLGGPDKIRVICADIFDAHTSNPVVRNRYKNSSRDEVIQKVWEFFCSGTGGPQSYTGKSMVEAHTAMNINGDEFVAVCDDVINALKKNEIGQKERDEVLAILFSIKGEIMHI